MDWNRSISIYIYKHETYVHAHVCGCYASGARRFWPKNVSPKTSSSSQLMAQEQQPSLPLMRSSRRKMLLGSAPAARSSWECITDTHIHGLQYINNITYITKHYIHTLHNTYIHTYMHTYLPTYIPAYIHAYIHMNTYIHTYIQTYITLHCIALHTYIHYILHNIHTYIHYITYRTQHT